MSNFLVSIIVPCYNASYYIKEVLESIQSQSYKNIECIIINDGSTDNTYEIIQTFMDEKRFHISTQENQGLSDTRNFALEKATGDFILFSDNDDILPVNAVENLVSAYTGKEDIILGKTATVSWKDQKVISYLPYFNNQKNQDIDNSHNEIFLKTITTGLSPMAQNKLYKTEFLKKNDLRFLSKIYHEDELWFFETMFKARSIVSIPQTTYNYTVDNPKSITKENSDKNLLGYLSVLKTIYNKYYLVYPEENITAYYIAHLKKIIIGDYAHGKKNYSVDALIQMQNTFKEINPIFRDVLGLSSTEKKYFRYINSISLKDLNTMSSQYMNTPVNSLRKHYKLLLFSIFNSK